MNSPLLQATSLSMPSRVDMLQRVPSVQRFWSDNNQLFKGAWKALDESNASLPFTLDASILSADLRNAVEQAWVDPNTESNVSDLWEEVSDGVYKAQFFDPDKLSVLRDYLRAAFDSGIPTRPPYGIALNRYGAMLDERSEGALGAPKFQAFYTAILDRYMRPIARLLFPEIVGYDTQTFGFSIQYEAGGDTSLQPHTDASAVTMNINMNTVDEEFSGSEVDFFDRASGKVTQVKFEPGVALIHRGNVPHTAHPITEGTRSNMVLWLYGDRMHIPTHVTHIEHLNPEERWRIPEVNKDGFAPF